MNRPPAPTPPSFPALVQQFFTEYLVAQRAVSPRTVACYRDALSLFLNFASNKLGKAPTAMKLADIRPELILAFLDHLEQGRKNTVRSRNLRLTALRAFLKFACRAPGHCSRAAVWRAPPARPSPARGIRPWQPRCNRARVGRVVPVAMRQE